MKLSPMKFSPPALVGGVRGRDSELAGGVIIRKDKAPPASALALAPPLKRRVRGGAALALPLKRGVR